MRKIEKKVIKHEKKCAFEQRQRYKRQKKRQKKLQKKVKQKNYEKKWFYPLI